jgi:hypothetical protein
VDPSRSGLRAPGYSGTTALAGNSGACDVVPMLFGPEPHELTETECWRLLNAGGIARVAITFGAVPRIVPVRYLTDGPHLVVCVGNQAALSEAFNNTVVALAVDSFADDTEHGWLVQVSGTAKLAPTGHPSFHCRQETPAFVATIVPAIIAGSSYRLCDNARPPGEPRHE